MFVRDIRACPLCVGCEFRLAKKLGQAHEQAVQGRLEQLARAQAQAKAMQQASKGGQKPGKGKGKKPGKGKPSKGGSRDQDGGLQALADSLSDLDDKQLKEMAKELQAAAEKQALPSDAELQAINNRLQQLIQHVIEKDILVRPAKRVPAKYEVLVNRYFQALSDDLGENEDDL